MSKLTIEKIRSALRHKIKRGNADAYRITRCGEIHLHNHLVSGSIRSGWTLYSFVDAPELPLMLGIESEKTAGGVGPRRAQRERITDKEAARELFVAGYLQALDDVAKALAVPIDAGFLQKLREKAASVQARAAIAKAVGGAS